MSVVSRPLSVVGCSVRWIQMLTVPQLATDHGRIHWQLVTGNWRPSQSAYVDCVQSLEHFMRRNYLSDRRLRVSDDRPDEGSGSMRHVWGDARGSRGLRLLVLTALPMLAALTGCSDYHWTQDYQNAENAARQQKKYLFIFYKWWLSDDSNRMHGDILPDPAVSARFRDTINVLLEKESSPEYGRYMSKFGVSQAPAFVIVAPDGSYQLRTGFIPKERFIEFAESAKAPRPPRPGPTVRPRPLAP